MESALEGLPVVATSREGAEWGCFSDVAKGFRPRRAFRLSRPAQDEEAGSLAMPREVPNAIGLRSGSRWEDAAIRQRNPSCPERR